eukprot:225723-Chlamydomonas_euryale.AAC.1
MPCPKVSEPRLARVLPPPPPLPNGAGGAAAAPPPPRPRVLLAPWPSRSPHPLAAAIRAWAELQADDSDEERRGGSGGCDGFDFVWGESPFADGPYLEDGALVLDDASLAEMRMVREASTVGVGAGVAGRDCDMCTLPGPDQAPAPAAPAAAELRLCPPTVSVSDGAPAPAPVPAAARTRAARSGTPAATTVTAHKPLRHGALRPPPSIARQ